MKEKSSGGKTGIRIAVVCIVVLAAVIGGLFLFRKFFRYSDVRLKNESDAVLSSTAVYRDLAGGTVMYDAGLLSFVDGHGSVLWSQEAALPLPRLEVSRDCGIALSQGGTEAYLFNRAGITGKAVSERPILDAAVSDAGTAALAAGEGETAFIDFYRSDGSRLDIEIKNILSGSGSPLDIALSPSGTLLAVAGISAGEGRLSSHIIFYDFSRGNADGDTVAGLFPDDNTLYAEIAFLSDNAVCAAGDNELHFFTLDGEGRPQTAAEVDLDGEIEAWMTSEDRVGILLAGSAGTALYREYAADGSLRREIVIPDGYTHAEYTGDYTVFYHRAGALVLTPEGRVKYRGPLDGNADKITFTGGRTFLQFGGNKIREMQLT